MAGRRPATVAPGHKPGDRLPIDSGRLRRRWRAAGHGHRSRRPERQLIDDRGHLDREDFPFIDASWPFPEDHVTRGTDFLMSPGRSELSSQILRVHRHNSGIGFCMLSMICL